MDTDLIVCTPGVCAGQPRIAGTRITVAQLVRLERQGMSRDRMQSSMVRTLTTGQVAAAFEWYAAHKDTVDKAVERAADGLLPPVLRVLVKYDHVLTWLSHCDGEPVIVHALNDGDEPGPMSWLVVPLAPETARALLGGTLPLVAALLHGRAAATVIERHHAGNVGWEVERPARAADWAPANLPSPAECLSPVPGAADDFLARLEQDAA